KHGDEFIGCTDHRVFSVVSTGNIFLYCLVPAAVFGHSRGSHEHFFSVAVSIFRTRGQPVGDDFGGTLEALEFAVPSIVSNRSAGWRQFRSWTYSHSRSRGSVCTNASTDNVLSHGVFFSRVSVRCAQLLRVEGARVCRASG